jgi:hypothetical protein
MKATILSLVPCDWPGLMPTPNATESEAIREEIASHPPRTTVGLTERPLSVYATHRGSVLYLENGATIYRMNPPEWCNGYAAGPTRDPEECLVFSNGEGFRVQVEFEA